jgi:uncharacterized protein (TIGR02996 family)
MDHAKAFLEAIREEPDDDAHRLIYADWLEERGDPRGAFIRAQVRLARTAADEPARPDLEDEVQDLLAEHGAEWAAPLPGLAREWEFRRGFVEHVTIPGDAFLAHADRLFDAFPLRELRPVIGERAMAALARCPQLARLEALDFDSVSAPSLYSGYMRDRGFRVLLESPHLTRLTALNVAGCGIDGPGVEALVHSPLLSRLTRLDLGRNLALGDEAAGLLASAARAGGLQVLRLQGANMGPVGLRALLHSTCLPRLRTLGIHLGPLFQRTRNPAAALRDLLAGPLLARLTALEIGNPRLTGSAVPFVQALAAAPALARLLTLDLANNSLGDEGARCLAACPHLAGLTALNLHCSGTGPAGLQALADSPHLAGVAALDLGGNAVRDTGARALAGSAHLKRLTRLGLSWTGIGGPGIQALAASPNLGRLRRLDLAGNVVGPAGAQALAASPYLRRLNHLDLSSTDLGPDGGRALAQSPNLARPETLLLRNNRLGDKGVRALAASPHLARLVELDLDSNGLTQAGTDALMRSPHLRRLKRLGLRNSLITHAERERLRAHFGAGVVF